MDVPYLQQAFALSRYGQIHKYALDPAIKAQIDAGWDSDRDRETVIDEYIDTLEKPGF
jgi:hypothetical protein